MVSRKRYNKRGTFKTNNYDDEVILNNNLSFWSTVYTSKKIVEIVLPWIYFVFEKLKKK